MKDMDGETTPEGSECDMPKLDGLTISRTCVDRLAAPLPLTGLEAGKGEQTWKPS